MIKNNVMKVFQELRSSGIINQNANVTFICLLSKNWETLKNVRFQTSIESGEPPLGNCPMHGISRIS